MGSDIITTKPDIEAIDTSMPIRALGCRLRSLAEALIFQTTQSITRTVGVDKSCRIGTPPVILLHICCTLFSKAIADMCTKTYRIHCICLNVMSAKKI